MARCAAGGGAIQSRAAAQTPRRQPLTNRHLSHAAGGQEPGQPLSLIALQYQRVALERPAAAERVLQRLEPRLQLGRTELQPFDDGHFLAAPALALHPHHGAGRAPGLCRPGRLPRRQVPQLFTQCAKWIVEWFLVVTHGEGPFGAQAMRARVPVVLSSGKRILEQIGQASRTLELVTPYVRGAALEDALVHAPARRKRLLTRYRPADILSGATDVAMLGRLRRKLEVRVIEDVQARAYIVDGRWAYVGSCALTPASLLDSGADMGVAVCDEVSLRLLYAQFAQLWTRATEMTAAQWMLAQHAADGARDIIEGAHRDMREAERALGRFV